MSINSGKNQELLSKCKTLQEYSSFVAIVRRNLLHMEPEEAIRAAVDECIQTGILKDFLLKNKAEVIAVSIYEYNEKAHIETIRAEEREIAEQERARAVQAETRAVQAETSIKEILKNLISSYKKESLSKENAKKKFMGLYETYNGGLELLFDQIWNNES